MRTGIVFCKNCGVEYMCQLSGAYILETPKEYNDNEYCPTCKKTIIDALALIPKKTDTRFIDTDDFTIDELIKISETKRIFNSKNSLPICRRVYATLLGHRTDSVEFNGCEYIFTYCIDSHEAVNIRKKVRWDLERNCEYKK